MIEIPNQTQEIPAVIEALNQAKELIMDGSLDPELIFPLFLDNSWMGVVYNPELQLAIGHHLYRISDEIPLKKRRRIPVYPQGDGEARKVYDLFGETRFYSLEQWRRDWEKDHSPIPLRRRLPSNLQGLLE